MRLGVLEKDLVLAGSYRFMTFAYFVFGKRMAAKLDRVLLNEIEVVFDYLLESCKLCFLFTHASTFPSIVQRNKLGQPRHSLAGGRIRCSVSSTLVQPRLRRNLRTDQLAGLRTVT